MVKNPEKIAQLNVKENKSRNADTALRLGKNEGFWIGTCMLLSLRYQHQNWQEVNNF